MKYGMSCITNPLGKTSGKQTVTEFLRHWSDTKPDKDAFVFVSDDGRRETVTWRHLYYKSVQFAKAFISLGVREGDVVGISLRNCPDWLYIAYGAVFARAIPFGIEFTYADGRFALSLLQKVGKCSAFILNTDSDTNTWSIFQTFLSSVSKDGKARSELIPSLRFLLTTSLGNTSSGVMSIDEFLKSTRNDIGLPFLVPDDIFAYFHTSGTTGIPKIIAHTHSSITFFATDSFSSSVLKQGEIIYNDKPFGWCGGGIVNTVINGVTRVLRTDLSETQMEHAKSIIGVVRKERCFIILALPPLIRNIMAIMAEPVGDGGKTDETILVNTILCGGQPATKELVSCVGNVCNVFINQYGSAECLNAIAKRVSIASEFEDNNCGTVMGGSELKIVNEAGDVVPVRIRGELHVRGPTLFSGYVNEQEKTKEVLTDDGWYKTDDIGYMTEDGEFFIEGRKSDVILCGGINVIPGDLECFLKAMPGIDDAIVVPIPDDKYFRLLCACLVPSTGSTVTEDEVRKYYEDLHNDKTQLYYLFPSYYLFFKSFPETFTGKTHRRVLQEEAVRRIKSE